MRDEDCVRFLQWCLPPLGLRWAGYRRVRRTVCKRIERRRRELGLADAAAYRACLIADPGEWTRLDALCRISISRFYRDRAVFDRLVCDVLPNLATKAGRRADTALRCWSAGCASGEEPYSLAIAWRYALRADHPGLRFEIVASDDDPVLLARARAARYPAGSLKDLPRDWRAWAFERDGNVFHLRPALRRSVAFCRQDIRGEWPEGRFDLVLCRNLAFTYFAADRQRVVLQRLSERLRRGGILVIGGHEMLPDGGAGFRRLGSGLPVYRKSN